MLLRNLLLACSLLVSWSTSAAMSPSAEQWAMYEKLLHLPDLVKGGRVEPIWLQQGSQFVYRGSWDGKPTLLRVDPDLGKVEPFLDRSRLITQLSSITGIRIPSSDTLIETFSVPSPGTIRFVLDGRGFELQLTDYQLREISPEQHTQRSRAKPRKLYDLHPRTPRGAVMEVPSPTGRYLASQIGFDIALRDLRDNRTAPLTSSGTREYSWSVAGAIWSPSGNSLLVMRTDNRGVHRMPVVNWLQRAEQVDYHYYAQAGGVLPRRELVFIDPINGDQVAVEMGEDNHYVRPLTWLPDGSEFWFFQLSRNSQHIALRAADSTTGAVRTVWSESNNTFIVSPMNYAIKPMFHLLSDGRFLVSSEKSGWQHLYLCKPDASGSCQRPVALTRGDYPVNGILRVDEKSETVYFNAHPDHQRPYDSHAMRVSLGGGKAQQLTTEVGHHQVQVSPDSRYLIDTHSTVNQPYVTRLLNSDGEQVVELARADISVLTDAGWAPPQEFTVKAADGVTDLFGIIRKPWNFDPQKSYPVVEYIYGGAQVAIVPRTFLPSVLANHHRFAEALSQLGFIVVTVDARGTPQRGKQFQDVVFGNWGRNEIADHAAALRQLAAQRPYMDLNRVGIFGSSYGGYYTTRALLQAPELYRAGVVSAPATELDTIAAAAIESYMGGRPQEVPAPYHYASNVRLASELAGKMLIIHPTSDLNAPFSHAMRLAHALIGAGKPFDMNVFPDGNHHYQYEDSGRRHVFWWNTVRDYFLEHLTER